MFTENRVQIRTMLYLPQKRPCNASCVQMGKDTMNGQERITGGILCQPEHIGQEGAVPDGARCPGSRIAGMSGRFPGRTALTGAVRLPAGVDVQSGTGVFDSVGNYSLNHCFKNS